MNIINAINVTLIIMSNRKELIMLNRKLYKGKSYKQYIKEELDTFYETKNINETSKSRIYSQLSDESDTKLAIISACTSDSDRTTELRDDVLDLGCGYVNVVARWINEEGDAEDESSLIIYNISLKDAIKLGTKYEQHSIIYKDENGLRLISTNPDSESEYKIGQDITYFDNSGTHFMNISDAEKIFAKQRQGDASYVPRAKSAFSLKKKEPTNESLKVFLVERGPVNSIFRYEPELQRII